MAITQKRLKELLEYDENTGVFTRRVTTSSRSQKGMVAGHVSNAGYVQITLDSRPHLAHRLAWLYVHGNVPKIIDHIDGNPANNSISNLRPASPSQNIQNSKKSMRNTSGLKGVHQRRKDGKWIATIKIPGRRWQAFLGSFDCPAAAHLAYQVAAAKHHGEFARMD